MSNRLSFIGAAWLCAVLAACGGGGGSDAPATIPVPAEVTSFFTAFDATRATAIPATGSSYFAMYDGCYLDGGRSKSSSIAEFDADPQSVEASKFRIGATRGALKVLADRTTKNTDGTSRRELDVQYNITYADGTLDKTSTTLIHGSSAGSKLPNGTACATPENKAEWRFYGNRKVVSTSVTAKNDILERYFLANGSALDPAVAYSKYILLTIEDPGRYATYAIVSGPGLVFSDGTPLALKMLSPRILRDDLLLAGKRGNYVDARDTASFAGCRTANGEYADALAADCVQFGAIGSAWGSTNWPTAAEADQDFSMIPGLVAGGVYTIKIYNDDGWKTVNGQAGRTPIATYTSTLAHLPYSAAALAGAGSSERFPRFTSLSKTTAEIATAVRNKAAIAVDATWSAPGLMPDSSRLGWGSVYAFASGRANALSADFPASRNMVVTFPNRGATQARLPSPTAGAQLVTPTFAEIGLFYTTHDGNVVASVLSFYD